MLTLTSISKTCLTPAGPVRVLTDVSLTIETGEAVAITGPSGSGKSTLLFIIGGLDAPTSGTVTFDGTHPYALSPEGVARFRNTEVGFVFQDHCLLPQLTVLDNVLVPTLVGDPDPDARDRARVLLTAVGLEPRVHLRPAQLSAGEQQRAAIARALIRSPRLLLCDEPTGRLGSRDAEAIVDLLLRLHVQQHATLLIATHSEAVASRLPSRLVLTDGRVA